MTETVYLTAQIKNTLSSMGFGLREKIALFLGDRVSDNAIYVTNTTGPFEGEINSVSLRRIFQFDFVMGAVVNANRNYRERYGMDKYVLFTSHSHPRNLGEIVLNGDQAWSVNDVTQQDDGLRGKVTYLRDKGNNLVLFALMENSDKRGGDDLHIIKIADGWRTAEYHFFVRPPAYRVGKPMTKEIAVDCYKYDPEMRLGKIRKIEIAKELLTPADLGKTLLDPGKPLVLVERDGHGGFVLPYRRGK